MDPAVGEVVLIAKALSFPQAEAAEGDFVRVVEEGRATDVGDAVLASVDHEAMEVFDGPAQGELEGGMQIGDPAVAADQEPPPRSGG